MAETSDTYFAIRLAGADGVERLYAAKSVGVYPTTATMPADASPETRATVGAIEKLLGSSAVVPVSAADLGLEGQMI